jgi:vacuole morphology and inheritance protein 14
MDQSVQRLLNDKLYDKRKQGALEYVKLSPIKLLWNSY